MDYDALYAAVTKQESGGNPSAVSPVGALGLMQVMPATAMDPGYGMPDIFAVARQFGFQPGDKSAATAKQLLRDPEVNAAFGKMYLDRMIRKYDGDVTRALVAYNAGPGRANGWDGDPLKLPKETQGYVRNITADYARRTGEGIPSDVRDIGSSARPVARPEEQGPPAPDPVVGVMSTLGGEREARRKAAVAAAPGRVDAAARGTGISTAPRSSATVSPKRPPAGGIMDLIGAR